MIIYMDAITRDYVNTHPEYLFVFGDNDERMGYGGQANAMRGAVNSHGIRVKKSPTMQPDAFYKDDELEDNAKKIQSDITSMDKKVLMLKFEAIVFPTNGIGTGLAQLEQKAPLTWDFLCTRLRKRGITNGRKKGNA